MAPRKPSDRILSPALRVQPDRRLVALAREGSEPAVEEIVRRYRPALVRYAASIVPADRADDVTSGLCSPGRCRGSGSARATCACAPGSSRSSATRLSTRCVTPARPEFLAGDNPRNADTDSDGIPDGEGERRHDPVVRPRNRQMVISLFGAETISGTVTDQTEIKVRERALGGGGGF